MKYTQDMLRAAARRLFDFSEKALKAGRTEDAADLAIGSDVLGTCADNYGMQASEIKALEDPDEAAASRISVTRRMCPTGEAISDQECCPFSLDGICPVCRVFKGVFTIEGSDRRFICYTQWSSR